MKEKILIVDDEIEIADLLEVYLKNEGYEVYKFYNGRDALKCVEETELSLAVLDVMLPDISGFQMCRKIRERFYFPIIMLTAKVEDMDKINGLAMGADDYITKPFNPMELIARVKTQLRRYRRYNPVAAAADPSGGQQLLEHDIRALHISKETHKCILNGEELSLTPLEFDILWYLRDHKGQVVSSEKLYEEVWGCSSSAGISAPTGSGMTRIPFIP